MTTILFHAMDTPQLEQELQDALSLARAADAHLSCIHVTPAEAFVSMDSFGGVYVANDMLDAVAKSQADVQGHIAATLANEDVAWDYQAANGGYDSVLCAFGSLSDLIVASRRHDGAKKEGLPAGTLGDIVMNSRSTLFIPGDDGAAHDPFAPVVVGWDGGVQAAAAVRGAMPWLKQASSVRVVTVQKSDGNHGSGASFPSTRLLEYLSRGGVNAELVEVDKDHAAAEESLLQHVQDMGARTLVIGGYGHSRLGEYLMGGVTKSLLGHCPVGLIIAH